MFGVYSKNEKNRNENTNYHQRNKVEILHYEKHFHGFIQS